MTYASQPSTTETIVFTITHLVMISCMAGVLFVIWRDQLEPENEPWLFQIKLREKFKRRVELVSAHSFKIWLTAVKVMYILFF